MKPASLAFSPSCIASGNRERILVISAVNIISGGPLKILYDCVHAASDCLLDWKIYVLVNSEICLDINRVVVMSFSYPKKSWSRRLFFEWAHCYFLSIRLKADLWLCLHDITALAVAKKQYVYFHNPAPFFEGPTRLYTLDFRFLIFRIFYRFVYKIFSGRNHSIVVQQDWIRTKLRTLGYKQKIIVAYPYKRENVPSCHVLGRSHSHKKFVFIYPAFPRPFKNHLILVAAVKLLPSEVRDKIEILFTLNGSENKYSKLIKQSCENWKCIKFIGLQSSTEMFNLYSISDAVLFPSLLETWGLPITEAIQADRPLVVSNLPYALETLDGYGKAILADPLDSLQWATAIERLVNGNAEYSPLNRVIPAEPFISGWDEFWATLNSSD